MKQQELELDKVAFLGIQFTDWAKGSPPCCGWWPTDVHALQEAPDNAPRRFWNGQWWSKPAYPDDTAEAVELARGSPSVFQSPHWCGLKQPHPDGYPFDLATGEDHPKVPKRRPVKGVL